MHRRAFTLIELLIVVAIISIGDGFRREAACIPATRFLAALEMTLVAMGAKAKRRTAPGVPPFSTLKGAR